MFRGPFARQREKLALRLDEVLRQYLSDSRTPEVTDTFQEVYGEYAIGKFPERHEMRFFLDEVNCFTPELANRLRTLVSREFPKWSIVPQFNECVFTVRAGGVEFDGEVVKDIVRDTTPAFVRWQTAAREFDERKYGPLRRQLRWISPRLLDGLMRLESERVVLLGAFDRTDSGEGYLAWLLVAYQDRDVSFGPVQVPTDGYGVSADGSLRAGLSRRPKPPACLLIFRCHASPPSQVAVTSDEEGTIATVPFSPVVSEAESRGDG